jgi:hypothetical protein
MRGVVIIWPCRFAWKQSGEPACLLCVLAFAESAVCSSEEEPNAGYAARKEGSALRLSHYIN